MDKWAHEIERCFPVTAQRMGNGSWIAVWKEPISSGEGYGYRSPDTCFSVEELEGRDDWPFLVQERLGLPFAE